MLGLYLLCFKHPGLRVLDTGGSNLCFPSDHPGWLSVRYGSHEAIRTADVILVLDCDVPWINTQCKPSETATIIHLDTDPLKQQMPLFYIDAILRCRVSVAVALKQILQALKENHDFAQQILAKQEQYTQRWSALQGSHADLLRSIASQAAANPDGSIGVPHLLAQVRKFCPPDTIWAVEAVTNTFHTADQLQPTEAGSWFNCGSGGLGWSGGAALGIKLASDNLNGGPGKGRFVCQIVGDGCFMFSMPSTVYWIGQRYGLPVLTILINNDGESAQVRVSGLWWVYGADFGDLGWNAPRKSMLLVHPEGLGSRVDNQELNISFSPNPDYCTIAKGASRGTCWAEQVSTVEELAAKLPEAVAAVQGGRSALLDARVVK